EVEVIAYPWISFATITQKQGVDGVGLSVEVRGDPPITGNSRLSLSNFHLEITSPYAITPKGDSWYFCSLVEGTQAQFNDVNPSPNIGGFDLRDKVTMFEVHAFTKSGKWVNQWYSIIFLRKRGSNLDWEEFLSGTAYTPEGDEKRIVLSEKHASGKTS